MSLNNNVSGVEQVANNPSGAKMVDRNTGIQSIRGGQRVGDGFIDSVINAYANLMYHPISLFMLFLGVFIFVAELNNTHGPLELMLAAFTQYMSDPTHPQYLVNLASIMVMILNFLVKYKIYVASMCLLLFTTVSKPSTRTFIVTAFLAIYVLYVKHMTVLEIFIVSQLFFLFCNLRTPSHKLAIAALAGLIFMTTILDLKTVVNNDMSTKTVSELYSASFKEYKTNIAKALKGLPKNVTLPNNTKV